MNLLYRALRSYVSRSVPVALFLMIFGVAPLHAQLNFSSGPFTVGLGANTINFAPTGGSGNYTMMYAPAATPVPGMQVLNRPNVPSTFSPTSSAGLMGIPSAPGSYATTIRLVDNGTSQVLDKPVTVNVRELEIGGSVQSGYGVGDTVAFQLWGSGGTAPYTFAHSTGTLPPGLTLNTSTGLISGTLTAAGNFSFTITLTDNASQTFPNKGYAISVSPLRLTLTDRFLPVGYVNQAYTHVLTASGCVGSCTFSVPAGNVLPAGLTLSSNGIISGTSTVTTYGQAFTVSFTDGTNTATRRLTLAMLPQTPQPLRITTNTIRDVVLGFNSFVTGITANGGLPPYAFSLEPSSVVPPDTRMQSSASIATATDAHPGYLWTTARTAGNFTVSVKVTDSAGNFSIRDFDWRVTSIGTFHSSLPAPSPGPAVTFGLPYLQPMVILGGTPPYTVTTQSIPAGLTIDNLGFVTGTPQEFAGVNQVLPLNFTVQDSAPSPATYVNTGFVTINPTPPARLTLTGGTFSVLKGSQTAINITATATPSPIAPYTATILSGALPPGLLLLSTADFNPGNSTIVSQVAGVPTAVGTYTILLKLEDSAGSYGQRVLTFVVSDLDFVNTGVKSGTVGVPYDQPLDVRGGTAPYTFSLTNGSLPSGLTLDPLTGLISGTPTSTASASVGIRATDSAGDTVARTYTLNIYSLEITGPSVLPTAYFGESYSYQFTANPPGAYVWTAAGLPVGMTLNSTTGLLTGVPTSVAPIFLSSGPTITAGTASSVVSRTFTLFGTTRSASGLLSGMPFTLGPFIGGSAVNALLNVAGGEPPYTVGLAPASALPPGLALVPGETYSGTTGFGRYAIAGIPTTPGTYSFQLDFSDSTTLTVRRSVSITILGSLSLAVTTLRNGIVNVPYSAQLYGVGGTGAYTFTLGAGGILPPGLSLSPTGVLSGTSSSTGGFNFPVSLSDGVDVRVVTVFVTFTNPDLRLITFGLPSVLADVPLGRRNTVVLTPTGGAGVHSWSLVAGALPPGVQLLTGATVQERGFGPNVALLTGVHTTPGTYTFTLRVDDSTGNVGIRQATGLVTPLRAGPANQSLLLNSSPPPLQIGVPYSFAQTAINNNTPVTFTPLAGGVLPAGVTADSAGLISGTPTEAGNFGQAYIMTDQLGNTTTVGRTLLVYPAGNPIGVVGVTAATLLSNATVGTPFSFNLNDLLLPGYGTAPFAWSMTTGSLPSGLSIAGDVLTGTPSVPGPNTFGVKVTDANGTIHIVPSVSITVAAMSIAPAPGILPPAAVGQFYSRTFAAAGGTPPYVFRTALPTVFQPVLTSDMPVGLSLSPDGILSGTPSIWGPFMLSIEAVDANGEVFLQRYTLNVAPSGTVLPALTAAPSNLSLTYVTGNPSPTPVPINVGSTSTNFAFSAQTSGGSWLSVAPGGGTTPGVVNLNFDTSGLTVGTYNGALTLTSNIAVNAPLAIPVTLTVNAPAPCGYSLSPGASSVLSSGGSASFSVTTAANCSWAASTSDSWITVLSPGSGTGSGTVSLSLQANPGSAARTGTVIVEGHTYTLTQFGTDCAFTLSPSSMNASSSGGTGSVTVSSSATGCAWSTTQVDSWLSATGAGSGVGSGSVDIAVAANGSSSSRTGTILIGGQTFTVDQAGLGCTYSLSSVGTSVPSSGSSSGVSVNITSPSGCSWTADPGPGWITVISGGSGIGNGTIVFAVAANSSTSTRSGVASVGGQSYEITQPGVPCSFSIGVDNPILSSAAGNGNVSITADSSCGWIASSNAPWLTLSSGTGMGSGSIGFNATLNSDSAGRSGTITIAGQNLIISQSGTVCEYILRSPSASVPSVGGGSAVGVIAASGCAWTATSSAPFVTITSGASSSGSGTVNFSVQPNTSALDRTGFLTIAGHAFAVTQQKAACTIVLGSTSADMGEFSGNSSFTYTTSVSDCAHSVQSYSSWITVTSANYAGTSGTVTFSVAANGFAAPRSGIIKVGDLDFTVNQAASTCSYVLTTFSKVFGRLGGSDEIPIQFSPSGCGAPPVLVNAPFGMITLDAVTPSPGVYTQSYTTNIYQSFINYIRSAQLLINGQIFTVKQKSWVDSEQ